ncbi:GTPase HflX [Candidatus Dependentiae bacterium]
MKHRKVATNPIHTPKTALLGVHAPYNRIKNIQSYYEEFVNLVRSNELAHDEEVYMKIRDVNPVYFLTKGKLQELKDFCEKNEIEQLIISEPLSSQQEKNLSDYLGCNVCDRTQLILEIFEKHAHSAEGKTQVEIAMLRHQKTRLAGKGIHMSQQSGITGKIGGPGETAKERETRDINQQISTLKKRLEKLKKVRETQRKNRFRTNVPNICLIGYTNAGKSTILNTLTKSKVLAEDKLFATLDTTTRELYIGGKKKGILSDSVGFIQQLPHNLIDAFKSTLDELQYADLLLHVIDISDPNWEMHTRIVNDILQDLNIEKDILYIFNKSDKIDGIIPKPLFDTKPDIEQDSEPHDSESNLLLEQVKRYNPYVLTSAKSKDGVKDLVNYLSTWKRSNKQKNKG